MALGSGFTSGISAGVGDLFAASADEAKAQADISEQQEYSLAGTLATQNEQFTAQSTAIKEAQQNRETTQALDKTQASVGGAGFAESGSAIDILRSGAQQGAQLKAVASEQGLVTEAGYNEQAQSYNLMATAAGTAASAEKTAATGADIGAAISFAGAAFSLVGGGGSGSGQNPTGPANSDGDQGMGGWAPAMPGL